MKILLSVIAIFFLSTYLYLDKTELAFGHIITFLSIITGFCITALSIIATSNFAQELYKIDNSKDNSISLLHNLTNIFRNCILYSSTTIVLVLFFYYFSNIEFCRFEFLNTSISLKTIIIGGIWYFTIVSIITFLRLVFLFQKFIIKNVSRKDSEIKKSIKSTQENRETK